MVIEENLVEKGQKNIGLHGSDIGTAELVCVTRVNETYFTLEILKASVGMYTVSEKRAEHIHF